LFSGTGKLGLNLEVKGFELNAGAGLKDGEMDFSRFAFGYRNEKREGLRITYDSTPLKDQLMLDGRFDLTEHITAQGIVDDSGNFRIRGLLHDGPNSLSIAGGKSGDEAVFNVSANTDKLWVSGSYSESRGIQGRLVLGDIPKNRSDLYGGVDIPGANDISLFPDQTVKPTIGNKPTLGMLALAPQTFLSQDPGSMVLDISGQENQRISARGALRLEDLGPAKNPWIAAGTYYDLTSEKIGFTIEAGAKALGGEIRLMTEFKEGTAPVVGVLYQVKF
jgi:hypothetical protein